MYVCKSVVSTCHRKDSRCSDHRLGQNFPLTVFLNGDLATIHQKCIADDQQANMKLMIEGQQKS